MDANLLFDVEKIDKLIEEERNRPKHDKVVIYLHGLHGSFKEAEDFNYLKDYDVIGLNYKDGNPWEVGPIVKEEFERIIKPYQEVVVIANSIGAFYAYEYLSEFKIKQAFFISPIASMSKIISDYIYTGQVSEKELKEKRFVKAKDGTLLSYDFYELYSKSDYHANWDIHTDILYGEHDELVYIENIADFLAAHPKAKLTIKRGAEHYFHTKEEKNFIKKWILRSLI